MDSPMPVETLASKQLEALLRAGWTRPAIKGAVYQVSHPYRELMAYYRCAMMEVATKFNVLNEELSLQ